MVGLAILFLFLCFLRKLLTAPNRSAETLARIETLLQDRR